MAAGYFSLLAGPAKAWAISAGTQPAAVIHLSVREVMLEVGVERTGDPQLLTTKLAQTAGFLVTMGCGEACPVVPGLQRADWPLPDPKGRPIDEIRQIRERSKFGLWPCCRRTVGPVHEKDRFLMLNAVSGEVPVPLYREAAESANTQTFLPYRFHQASNTLFRCQSRPRHNTRADAIGYRVLGAGAVLAAPTVGVSLIPVLAYFDILAPKRCPDFLKLSRHLFYCVGAVATRKRTGAIVDALVATGALHNAKSRSLRDGKALEADLNVVRPDTTGGPLTESEKVIKA